MVVVARFRKEDAITGSRLAGCVSGDDILDALQGPIAALDEKRAGGKVASAIRCSLRPIVLGLRVFLDVGAEVASSSGIPCGNAIFVAISVLLRAADRVGARSDDLMKLLKHYQSYIRRLSIRMHAAFGDEAIALAVEGLVSMLRAFMLATKSMREGRFKQFFRALFARSDDVQEAITALDDVITEDERLTMVELVVGVHDLTLSVNEILEITARSESVISRVLTSVCDMHTDLAGAITSAHHIHEAKLDRLEHLMSTNAEALTRNHSAPDPSRLPVQPRSQSMISLHMSIEIPSVQLESLRGQANAFLASLTKYSDHDRVIIKRALAMLYAIATEMVADSPDGSLKVVRATLENPAQVLAAFVPMACLFLSFYALWRCILRPICFAPGRVVLIDVLGKVFVLEDDAFLSAEGLHAFLINNFARREGLRHVQNREYTITDAQRSEVVNPATWAQTTAIQPGMTLLMSIVVQRSALRCPYCRVSSSSSQVDLSGSVTCSNERCRRAYQAHRGHKPQGGEGMEEVEPNDHPEDETAEDAIDAKQSADDAPEQGQAPRAHVPNPMNSFQRILVLYTSEDANNADSDRLDKPKPQSKADPALPSQPSHRKSGNSSERFISGDVYDTARVHYRDLDAFLRSSDGQRSSQGSRTIARAKLVRLTRNQFFEQICLAVHDELVRRTSAKGSVDDVLFLPAREDLPPKSNEARAKLSTLPMPRFADLSSDVHHELGRRCPEFVEAVEV
ncbi:unnamed protein product [Peniophora sp. CBMAI 1063]|nr:unnamed protein product [Peniophora sp. CBMAI 1063]